MAFTDVDDSSAHFQVKTWTGNGGTNAITLDGNSNMQPDFMWHKEHTDTNGWHQFDSSRGVTKYIASNSTGAEGTFSSYLSSFDSNGFTAGSGDSSMNSSSTAQCSWMWHCNSGTTSSNTDGATTSTVQANTTAGFSIITWTGTGSATTLGHGLGVAPKMLIVKNLSSATDWAVYHSGLSDAGYVIALNNSDPQVDSGTNRWNHTDPTSSVFSVGTGQQTNENTSNMVCYAFAEKQGFSKIGAYSGKVSGDNGPFIYTGFRPAFVMIKLASAVQSWDVHDIARNPFNTMEKRIIPNSTGAEETRPKSGGSVDTIDFVSNGFKIRSVESILNKDGEGYIFIAFAEHPLVTSKGNPVTAR